MERLIVVLDENMDGEISVLEFLAQVDPRYENYSALRVGDVNADLPRCEPDPVLPLLPLMTSTTVVLAMVLNCPTHGPRSFSKPKINETDSNGYIVSRLAHFLMALLPHPPPAPYRLLPFYCRCRCSCKVKCTGTLTNICLSPVGVYGHHHCRPRAYIFQ